MAINKNDYLDGDGNYDLKKALVDEIIDEFNTHLAENANKAHGGFKGVLLRKTTPQSIANNTMTTLTWEQAIYDSNNLFSFATPTRITIPTGVSKVRLSGSVWWGSVNVGNRHLRIMKNGAGFLGYGYVLSPAITASPNQVFTAVVDVSQGDYFELEVSQNSGGSLLVDSADITWFNLEVVE